jgi:hypothetical protein
MISEIPVGRLGRILAGPEAGRVMEVVDDAAGSGGVLVVTYTDLDRTPPVFDTWFENFDELRAAFAETGWQVDWQPET